MNKYEILSILEMADPYTILGIDKNATYQDIKRIYVQKSKILHPDKGGNPAEFKALQKAYSILSNKKLRDRYDKLYTATFSDLKQEFKEFNIDVSKSIKHVQEYDDKEFNKKFLDQKINAKKDTIDGFLYSTHNNYDDESNITRLKESEFNKKLADIQAERDIMDKKTMPVKVDEKIEEVFDVNAFQQMFEHLKQEAQKNEIILYSEPSKYTYSNGDFSDLNEAFKNNMAIQANTQNCSKLYKQFQNTGKNVVDEHKMLKDDNYIKLVDNVKGHEQNRESLKNLNSAEYVTNEFEIHSGLFNT